MWTFRPTNQNATEARGMRIIAIAVSFTETLSIERSAKVNVISVNAPCMSAGPYIWRTAVRSFVRRAMRSPIR